MPIFEIGLRPLIFPDIRCFGLSPAYAPNSLVYDILFPESSEDFPGDDALLAEQAEQIAGGLVQKGILTRQDGDKFRVDFSWAGGQGILNGEPLQLK